MTCSDFQEEISQYIDNALSEAAVPGVFEHMSSCSSCRHFMGTALTLRTVLLHEPTFSTPETLDNRVKAIASLRPVRKRFTIGTITDILKSRLEVPLLAVVVGAVLLFLSILVSASMTVNYNTQHPSPQQEVYIMSLPTVEVEGHTKSPARTTQ